jgi:adenylate cyclase
LLVSTVLLALAHTMGVMQFRAITELDFVISDTRVRALMPATRDPRIVVVDIDEKSLASLGRWPWARNRMAALVNELFIRQNAAVVGFDVLFAEPDSSSGLTALENIARQSSKVAELLPELRAQLDFDAIFARSLMERNVVLGYYFTNKRGGRQSGALPAPVFDTAALRGIPSIFTRWDGYTANLALLAHAAPHAGYFNHVPDIDGQLRSIPLISELNHQHYEALSLAMFRMYTNHPDVVPVRSSQTWLPNTYSRLQSIVLSQGTHQQIIPTDEQWRVRVPFRGPGGPLGGSFEYVSASDLLMQRTPANHLAGKLVLVGSTAPGIYDQRSTPVSEVYPGVEVHASLLSGLLDGKLPSQPDWVVGFDALQLLVIAALLIGVLPRLKALRAAQFVTFLLLLLIAINWWAARVHGVLLPLALALALTCALYVGISTWGYIIEGRSRRSLAKLFGTYVPSELVAEMARDPARYDMKAENRVLTIMFCDMRNFTQVSELLAPEHVRTLMNIFFSTMTKPIRDHRGTLDKYIGDAIMAFWGAPLSDAAHAVNATHTALVMMQRLNRLNAELRSRKLPEIGLSIGLNTGLVCVGDMGSNIRRSYTVIGDPVNLSSRIEGLTRRYGLDLLISETTRNEVATAQASSVGHVWRWVEVDRVCVKGKKKSVTLFTIATESDENSVGFDDEMRTWQLALTAYRLQHWSHAQTLLATLLSKSAVSRFVVLYAQFSERIQHYRITPPPPDWDGAYTFDSK